MRYKQWYGTVSSVTCRCGCWRCCSTEGGGGGVADVVAFVVVVVLLLLLLWNLHLVIGPI